MRKLIILVVVSALLYGGYWFVGRFQIQDRLTVALAEIDAGDLDLSYGTLHTRGFPSRFDTTVTELEFTDPATATTWKAPLFQLFALSYRPNEVIAVFPNEQTLTIDNDVFTILSTDMRASGKVRPNASLAFQNATVEIDNPHIRTADGIELGIASVLAAMRLTPETSQTYDLFFEARSIELPDNIRRMIDPQNQQPPQLEYLRIDSDVDLTSPIQLLGEGIDDLSIEALAIKEFALTWGEMSLSAIGDVVPDAEGLLNGSITVSARNWQQALDLAVSTGAVKDERRFLVTEIANNLDETPQVPDTMTVTLTVVDGEMAIGPYALGPAPRLR